MSAEDQPKNPEDFFWNTYLKASEDDDKTRPENWQGSTNGILTFTGLFAATVAAFIIESYTLLSPDSSDRTNALLEQLFVAMANTSSNIPVVVPPSASFSPSTSAVAVNVFWFTSLLIALICALLSTLVQEWSRNYVQDIKRRKVLNESLRDRALNHIYICMGVTKYGMDQFVSWIIALVHLSVFLFACGLLVFLFPINHVVAGFSSGMLALFLVIYCVASVIPLFDKSCPYRTPVSYVIACFYWLSHHGRNIVATLCSRFGVNAIGLKAYGPGLAGDDTLNKYKFRLLFRRQYPSARWDYFMTDPRFLFGWKCIYPQINDDNSRLFLKSLHSVISPQRNRDSLISHMCANNELIRQLLRLLKDSSSAMDTEPSSLLIDPEIFELVALLSERMYALEVEHYGSDERVEDSVFTSPWLITAIGYVSLIADNAGPSQLSARLCLAHIRWSLLKLCQKALKKNLPVLSEDELSNFFRHGTFMFGNPNPGAFLLLVNAGSYDLRPGDWYEAGASALLPLHNDECECCRSWRSALTPEGLAHVAACNALTAIAHVFESDDAQKSRADGHLQYAFLSFERWSRAFPMSENTKQRMPSPDFISVLRSAGLHDWLEPGSTFDTKPHSDGPNHNFLVHYPGSYCVAVLRYLARHVNLTAYRARILLLGTPLVLIPSSHTMGTPALLEVTSQLQGTRDQVQRRHSMSGAAGLITDSSWSPAPSTGVVPAVHATHEDAGNGSGQTMTGGSTSLTEGATAQIPPGQRGGATGHELGSETPQPTAIVDRGRNPGPDLPQVNDATRVGGVSTEVHGRGREVSAGGNTLVPLNADEQECEGVDLRVESTELTEVVVDEHRSLHAGIDDTALSAGAPANTGRQDVR